MSNSMIGDVGKIMVTVDMPANKADIYTLTVANPGTGLVATVTPPTHTIDAIGTPVAFEVSLTRTTADPANGFETHETVVGTHGKRSETSFRQIVPVIGIP